MFIQSNPGGAITGSIASGGLVYAFNSISTTPQPILSPDPARVSVTFHNPGPVDIFIGPMMIQNSGTDSPLVPNVALLGGCFRVYANGGALTLTGEVQKQWQAFSASGVNNPLTVVMSRI